MELVAGADGNYYRSFVMPPLGMLLKLSQPVGREKFSLDEEHPNLSIRVGYGHS